MKSGTLAAEAVFDALVAGRAGDELSAYPEAYRRSWLHEELYRARNFKPWMSKGLWWGSLMFGIDQMLLRGKVPPPATAAPEPPFQVENLGRGAQPEPQQRLRRQQRDMVTGGAIDFSDLPPISLSPTLACNLSEKHKKRDTLPH